MNAAITHRSPHLPPGPARRPVGPAVTPADDHAGGLPLPSDGRTRVRLVAPDDVPHGAVIRGHLIAAPDTRPARQLVAVPPEGEAGPEGEPLLECPSGLVLDRAGRRVLDRGEELSLTRREFELLQYLITHPGLVLTRGQLLRAVWGMTETRYSPPRTVDVHVARVRRKLGAHAASLQSLRGVGYRWSPHPGIGGAG
jgi:hypothetical protein